MKPTLEVATFEEIIPAGEREIVPGIWEVRPREQRILHSVQPVIPDSVL